MVKVKLFPLHLPKIVTELMEYIVFDSKRKFAAYISSNMYLVKMVMVKVKVFLLHLLKIGTVKKGILL